MTSERVMAYVDGELDAADRAAFEAEMAADPALAAGVAAQRKLAERLAAAYAPVLDEPVPLRLTLAAQAANDGGPRLVRWAALAACLVVGVVAGRLSLMTTPSIAVGGDVPARAQLAAALDHGLAAEPGAIRIGLTFKDGGGRYCRTFESGPDRLAGLACRSGAAWRLQTATAWTAASAPAYRTAASETPAAILAAVDQLRAGDTLGAQEERAARDGGWR